MPLALAPPTRASWQPEPPPAGTAADPFLGQDLAARGICRRRRSACNRFLTRARRGLRLHAGESRMSSKAELGRQWLGHYTPASEPKASEAARVQAGLNGRGWRSQPPAESSDAALPGQGSHPRRVSCGHSAGSAQVHAFASAEAAVVAKRGRPESPRAAFLADREDHAEAKPWQGRGPLAFSCDVPLVLGVAMVKSALRSGQSAAPTWATGPDEEAQASLDDHVS